MFRKDSDREVDYIIPNEIAKPVGRSKAPSINVLTCYWVIISMKWQPVELNGNVPCAVGVLHLGLMKEASPTISKEIKEAE
jgi:hypothetical protein